MISVYDVRARRDVAGEVMAEYFELGNVLLLARPQVSGQTMVDAGWEDAGDGIATVYSCMYYAGNRGTEWGQNVIIHITPIRQAGTVLTPEELDEYVDALLEETTVADVLAADRAADRLILWVQEVVHGWTDSITRAEVYDELLHKMQAVYYLGELDQMPSERALQEFDPEISFYGKNGDAVLHPTECTVSEEAGGSYELSMRHPISEDGRWAHLVDGAILKAPVPVPVIENAFVGQDMDVYRTTTEADLRAGPSEPTRISYTPWYAGQTYVVGANVTNGYDGHNYKCTNFDAGSGLIMVPPNNNPGWWSRIADMTAGSASLGKLKPRTELYYIEDAGGGWAKVMTMYGITGYVKDSQITFIRHETVQPVEEREVKDQLFRIYNVEISTDNRTVSVSARHVSYDLTGVLLGECDISQAPPAMAIWRVIGAMQIGYPGEIATDMAGDGFGTYTGDLSYKNGIYAMLDPDKGIIPNFRGRLIRDNWDLFLMKNQETNRGVRLKYGVNLRGVSWRRKSDGIINRVMPVAKDKDGNDLYLPEKWIDSTNEWPVTIMERLKVDGQVDKDDGTETGTKWTEAALLEEMRKKARERYSVDHVDAIVAEIDVNFTLLGDTEEYKQYRELQKLYMYDTIRVTDETIGLDQRLQVSRIEYDCLRGRYTGMKVGNVWDYGGRTVFGYNVGTRTIGYEKISEDAADRIAQTGADKVAPELEDLISRVQRLEGRT